LKLAEEPVDNAQVEQEHQAVLQDMERVRAKLTGQRWPRYHDLMQIQLRITMM